MLEFRSPRSLGGPRFMPPPQAAAGWCRSPLRWRTGAARQMKMRNAVARTRAPGVTAKSDGFTLPVTAVGIAAIVAFKLDQGKMARIDFDAAQFDGLHATENRHRPNELGCGA